MEAYRQIVDIKDHTINLLLPDKFKSGKVEIIVFPVEERANVKNRKPSDFRGCISKEAANAILNDIEQSRKEWKRDIN